MEKLHLNRYMNLYESLVRSINEGKTMQRTIDKKLWLSIASTCSRNKSTESEFIKPKNSATINDLLPRYVAALIIMKKVCPSSIDDINNNKTFKLVGNRLIELGCTFDQIKQEYINNGGTLFSQNLTNNQIKKEQIQLDKEQTLPVNKQVVTNTNTSIKKDNDPDIQKIPNGIKTYEQMLNYVQKGYTDLKSVCEDIYEILDSTYFELKKTFYEILEKDRSIYFREVTQNVDKKIYHRDCHQIDVCYVIITGKNKQQEGSFSITVNDNLLKHNRHNIGCDIVLPYDEFFNLFKTILAKLLYASQGKIINPLYDNLPKKRTEAWGTSDRKQRSFDDEDIDNDELMNIYKKVCQKYTSIKKCNDIFDILLFKQKFGNIDQGKTISFKDSPLYTFKTYTGLKVEVLGFNNVNALKMDYYIIDGNKKEKDSTIVWYWRTNDSDIYLSYNKDDKYRVNMKDILTSMQIYISAIFYFANNYNNLLK